jgi:hypothetical protein
VCVLLLIFDSAATGGRRLATCTNPCWAHGSAAVEAARPQREPPPPTVGRADDVALLCRGVCCSAQTPLHKALSQAHSHSRSASSPQIRIRERTVAPASAKDFQALHKAMGLQIPMVNTILRKEIHNLFPLLFVTALPTSSVVHHNHYHHITHQIRSLIHNNLLLLLHTINVLNLKHDIELYIRSK